jgi:hypothetical protein
MIDRIWNRHVDLVDIVLPRCSGATALQMALSARRATVFVRARIKAGVADGGHFTRTYRPNI